MYFIIIGDIYLNKYRIKGASKAKFRESNADDVSDKDESTLYIRGRYLCSGKLNYPRNMYKQHFKINYN